MSARLILKALDIEGKELDYIQLCENYEVFREEALEELGIDMENYRLSGEFSFTEVDLKKVIIAYGAHFKEVTVPKILQGDFEQLLTNDLFICYPTNTHIGDYVVTRKRLESLTYNRKAVKFELKFN